MERRSGADRRKVAGLYERLLAMFAAEGVDWELCVRTTGVEKNNTPRAARCDLL